MSQRPWFIALMVLIAGTAFWLAAAGPDQLLGIDAGNLGIVILLTCLWTTLWWLSRVPAETLESSASHGEWQAWIGLVFLGLAIAYFVIKLPLFAVSGPITEHPDAARAGRNVVLLVVAWLVLSSVLGGRWRNRVHSDERDREIAQRACGWGRGTLVALVFGLAVTLGFSPSERLAWATPLLLANLLILLAMVSHWVEIAAQALAYWRDRH